MTARRRLRSRNLGFNDCFSDDQLRRLGCERRYVDLIWQHMVISARLLCHRSAIGAPSGLARPAPPNDSDSNRASLPATRPRWFP
jgi:hypothetical protein